jgi:signal transduction histidine kinase/DNA-binding response OmpR family regulator
MPRPSGSLLALCTVPVVLLLMATATVAWRSASDLEDSRLMVGKTNEVLDDTQNLLLLSQSAEDAERGFVLTGDEEYLKPFAEAHARIPATIVALRTELADAPGQKARLESLNGYIEVKFAELNRAIEIRRAQGLPAVQQFMANNAGQAAMNSIRSLVNDMIVAEHMLLEERLARAHTAESDTFLVTGILFWILLAVCLAGGNLFWRNFHRLARTENELEIKARLLQATLDTVAEGIGAFDANGILVSSNGRFFDLFGLPTELAFKRPTIEQLIAEDPPGHGGFTGAVRLVSDGNGPAFGIYQSGGRTLEVNRSHMPGGGAVFTARDITESRNAEATLRQAQKMETVGQLTGGIAHDFNNLLQIIMTNLDLTLKQVDNPDISRRLKSAMTGAERGSRLTRQLLAFARRQPLKPEPVNLGRLVREVTELLRRTLGESITVEENVVPDLWNAMVDRSQIENAIVNLAINARDAMPDGGRLTIAVDNIVLDDDYARRHEDVKPGEYIAISVSDTGTGMTREVMDRAFDPFFSTKPEGRGTGLGLSMVYGFAKQSGGHARIESALGEGTTVRLYLPRSIAEEAPQQSSTEGTMAGHGEVILVVEDEPDVRSAVVLMLKDLGYRTIDAGNGQDALAILVSGTPVDLLFTDVVMPGEIQGRQLAQQAAQLRPGLKIVFTSGYTQDSIIHHGRLDDGVHLISKPYRKEELARKLRSVLGTHADTREEPVIETTEQSGTSAEEPKTEVPLPAGGAVANVVFAEDDALVRMATVDMLEAMNYNVVPASDLTSAIEAIESSNASILLVDVNLGNVDGREVAAEALGRYPNLKIIFATGRDPGDLLTRFPHAGVLEKPYGMPELKAMLEQLG